MMADLEKVLRGWERCKKCNMSPIAPREAHEAYYECEYTIGLYCGKDKLVFETIELLDELKAVEPSVSRSEQHCGNCNKVIEMDGWKACPWCGKRIDWEGWWKKNGTRNQDT